ncbi:MAG: hypothetical protein IKE55_11445 [Kiritimatiellae bacterium]|nr:hypothetical protein [Kiritimatiellia bacterium]
MKKLLIIGAAAAAFTVSARTVYDAGKALRHNCESGSYANPYTDDNGGVWSYLAASSFTTSFSGVALEMHAAKEDGKLDGWHVDDQSYPKLMVNVSGEAMESTYLGSAGYPIEADELILHPGDSGNAYAVLRFTVPQDGWYSAFASFHDINQLVGSQNQFMGVDVHVTLGSESAGDTELASTTVALEDYPAAWGVANRTHRFDYQMPVRYLTQGTRIQFVVGPNNVTSWGHMCDGTGVKALVVKEDEGRFYDSGVAFAANVAGSYANPYGTAQHGTWHALCLDLGATADETDFQSWIPHYLENSFDHAFTEQFTFGDGRVGFNTANGANEPFVTVNTADGKVGNLSPRELCVHPPAHWNKQCTVVRFRPPEAGRYSASVVARYLENAESDGVEVFLVAADQIVTNSVVSGDHVKSTMHLTFDNLLLATGEPVDIIVSPRSTYYSDATAVSAIFRREEGGVYDANKSFYASHAAGNTSVPFDDVLGGGAQWSVGSMEGSWLPNSFAMLSGFVPRNNTNPAGLSWWERSPDNSGSQYPRIAMTTNSVASWDDTFYITPYPRLAIAANEIFVHPNMPGRSTSCVSVRAIVPSNGIYRVRGRARDIDNTNQYNDGIRFTLAVAGCIPATSLVQMNRPVPAGVPYEASLEGDRLWLKAGEVVDAVVDPDGQYYCDSTGLGVCCACEGDGTAGVVNVDFTGTGSGMLSANAARAREGYGDYLSWNALRPGGESSAAVDVCRDANGTTLRNMAVSLKHDSGAAIVTGTAATGTTLLDSFVTSSGTDDTYTFTISNLKKNVPYTLWLYSASGGASGNASFTVGGVTKGVEGMWMLGQKMLTRFDVKSDANGEITGTFAAADGNGGAFNGLTLVGDIRMLSGMVIKFK